uniref:Pentacotripeptide-repeat region of PRORP domain-containing protein n=1 Tax=Rhizophagus irregularis (strain DAOM 181602 / DAOM 197198 / MUCL 43194) TaxID=747089 RepID=U9SZE5_RHIID
MRSGTNLEEVTKLFTLMHEKKLTPNKTTKPILKNIFRHHLNNDAISWIRELREKNFIDVGLEKEILSPSFFRGFEDMKARNLKPDIYSYVPLIHQLAQHERADEALKLIEVKEQKVHLNTVAYNVFIKALQTCRLMIKSGIEPNVRTYNALLSLFAEKGGKKGARLLFREMQRFGLSPDVYTYTSLINAYAKSLYETMIKDKVDPTFVTCAVLIDGHARIRELDFSRKLLTELISHGTSMNQITYNKVLSPDIFTPLMDAYAKQGLAEPARAIFEEMTTVGAKHNLYVYTILMDAYYRGHKYEAVWQMWKLTKKIFVTPLSKSKIYEQLLDLQQNEQNEHKENSSLADLIISGKIGLACKLLNEHLVKGWEKGLALSNIYEEKFSTQKKTLFLLANYINQGKVNKKITQYLKELKEEFPEVFYITREFAKSCKLNKFKCYQDRSHSG